MTMQGFSLTPGRINRFKGQILAHATPVEVLSRAGRQVQFPKNNSDMYVARRWIPYGGTAANPNQFFQNASGTDRSSAMVQAHLVQEGITPTPDSITPQDVPVVIQQYSCLYGFTDKTYDLYEDDIPQAQIEQTGERTTLVNEQIVYGTLKGCTNQFYGGGGTSRATVAGPITLGLLRKITKSLMANHGDMTTKVLKPSPNYATMPVGAGFFVYGHTDMEPDIRDLANFTPVEQYASGTAMPYEIGKCERFRFILSPDLPSIQDAGAAVGSLGLNSTTGTNIDVYQFVVLAQDAFSQVAVRGKDSIDPTFLPPGQKDKADMLGQRGYCGNKWYKAVMIENNGWLAIGNVGTKVLS